MEGEEDFTECFIPAGEMAQLASASRTSMRTRVQIPGIHVHAV